jgi:hypothetical protein
MSDSDDISPTNDFIDQNSNDTNYDAISFDDDDSNCSIDSNTSTASKDSNGSNTSSRNTKKKKPHWKYFTDTKITNEVTCNLCSKLIKTSGNTVNIKVHLEKYHISEWNALQGYNNLVINLSCFLDY